MGDCMNFPDTVDEYMEQYKMTDVRQVYSNGIEYVPIFRMKQWFEHEKAQLSCKGTTSDAISRQEELLDDGTLVVWTNFDMTKFSRVSVRQIGTHYGDLFYPDEE